MRRGRFQALQTGVKSHKAKARSWFQQDAGTTLSVNSVPGAGAGHGGASSLCPGSGGVWWCGPRLSAAMERDVSAPCEAW